MSVEFEQITAIFKEFIEAVLVEHNPDKALSLMADDVIGIGMGEQGIVTCKADAARIVGDGKSASTQIRTEVEYVNMQTRCFESQYGIVCGVLKIKTSTDNKFTISTLGQIMNFRKSDGCWQIVAIQATPLFEEIEELEAYPIKFAENVLETYRQQEQLAKNAQIDSVAVYMVNFSKGIFENSITKNDIVIHTKKGDSYEKIMFDSARQYLNDDECYAFISTFSLGNILRVYENGETELSMEYQMFLSPDQSIWMKTLVKLYTDKTDENLKGYLYVMDIDEMKCREQDLHNRLQIDSMTKLYNKTHSEYLTAQKLAMASPENPGAFFMIDLDYFKNINDTYGHKEGDRVLIETANIIKSLTTSDSVAGRLGGDEFCLYLTDAGTPQNLSCMADRLCEGVRHLIYSKENSISCSIGIVFCNKTNLSFDEVYQKADKALYDCKKSGRNGYILYTEPS